MCSNAYLNAKPFTTSTFKIPLIYQPRVLYHDFTLYTLCVYCSTYITLSCECTPIDVCVVCDAAVIIVL
jgi:hypothetical protein